MVRDQIITLEYKADRMITAGILPFDFFTVDDLVSTGILFWIIVTPSGVYAMIQMGMKFSLG